MEITLLLIPVISALFTLWLYIKIKRAHGDSIEVMGHLVQINAILANDFGSTIGGLIPALAIGVMLIFFSKIVGNSYQGAERKAVQEEELTSYFNKAQTSCKDWSKVKKSVIEGS